jgi:hypothetical protein
MSGLGDLDPEHASGVLEAFSWDVPEALRSLSRVSSSQDGPSRRHGLGRRRGGSSHDGDLSEVDLLQMQEEEYNRIFAREEIATREP